MNRCTLCGYGTTGEWWDEGICEDCHRHREQAVWDWQGDDDTPDHATDRYITQRPARSRGPAFKQPKRRHTDHDRF